MASEVVVFPPSPDLFAPGRLGVRTGVGPPKWPVVTFRLPFVPGHAAFIDSRDWIGYIPRAYAESIPPVGLTTPGLWNPRNDEWDRYLTDEKKHATMQEATPAQLTFLEGQLASFTESGAWELGTCRKWLGGLGGEVLKLDKFFCGAVKFALAECALR
eukprot:jgi/Tetstr1/460058/TSEL_005378.t1